MTEEKRARGRAPSGAVDGRSSLLRAAREVFAERGYSAASTREILDKAGTTAPTLYHHFGNKAGLYLAVASSVDAEIADAFEQSLASGSTFLDRLDVILEVTLRLHASDVAMVKLVAAMPIELRRNPDLSGHRDSKTQRRLRETVLEMCRTATDLTVPPEVAASAVMTVIYGLGRVAPTLDHAGMVDAVEALRRLAAGAISSGSR